MEKETKSNDNILSGSTLSDPKDDLPISSVGMPSPLEKAQFVKILSHSQLNEVFSPPKKNLYISKQEDTAVIWPEQKKANFWKEFTEKKPADIEEAVRKLIEQGSFILIEKYSEQTTKYDTNTEMFILALREEYGRINKNAREPITEITLPPQRIMELTGKTYVKAKKFLNKQLPLISSIKVHVRDIRNYKTPAGKEGIVIDDIQDEKFISIVKRLVVDKDTSKYKLYTRIKISERILHIWLGSYTKMPSELFLKLMSIIPKTHPYAFHILYKLFDNLNIKRNERQQPENKLKVKTIMEACKTLPTEEDVAKVKSNKHKLKEFRMNPFCRDFKALKEIYDAIESYSYYKDGKELESSVAEKMPYRDYIELIVEYRLKHCYSHIPLSSPSENTSSSLSQ